MYPRIRIYDQIIQNLKIQIQNYNNSEGENPNPNPENYDLRNSRRI